MAKISIIVAMGVNRVIGCEGKLPWHLPSDLAHFKRLTTGHSVVMGRKTWDSIPERYRPLPGRINVVLSRTTTKLPGAICISSIDQVLRRGRKEEEIFVIGGGEIYKAFLPITDRIYLTEVLADPVGDTLFPKLEDGWICTRSGGPIQTSSDEYPMIFSLYERKT